MSVIEVTMSTIAHVTDLGRFGQSRFGIPVNGAVDQFSARVANTLVGNPDGYPLIEIVATSFEFIARDAVLIAVTGAVAPLEVDGCLTQSTQPIYLQAGQKVRIGNAKSGLRSYLAIRGRIDSPQLLGSYAPDPQLGIGTTLTPGSQLRIESTFTDLRHPFLPQIMFRFDMLSHRIDPVQRIDLLPGPHAEQFPSHLELLTSSEYRVDNQSNHIGIRLQGPSPRRDRTDELLSRGVPIGAVEVPPSAELLILLRGRMVTAGYPVIAVVTSFSLDVLGQLGPGSVIAFNFSSLDAARHAAQMRHAELKQLRARVESAFSAVGIPAANSL